MSVFRTLTPVLERALQTVDQRFSRFIQPRRLRGKIIILSYCGWGTPQRVELTGRVVLPRTLHPPQNADPRWRNFANVLRRLSSREVGGVGVDGTLGGASAHAESDADGYFTLVFEAKEPFQAGWQSAELQLTGRNRMTHGWVQVVDQARFGVISDLDDTVIRSDVTSLPRMLMTVLTGNARSRSPFPGVGSLYRALTRDGRRRNPVFYVSSSPWNFFDLLWQFLDYRRIPLGPMFLRNWGAELLHGHNSYKHRVIDRILRAYPHLPFVLVGDSGEKDPEIYAEVVRRFPGRVLGVYIRDVTAGRGDERVLRLRDELQRLGVDMVLARDSFAAAAHAMALGLITPGELRSVAESVERWQHGLIKM
ncbi:App1 family protein [Deinococcus sonorensis]|uniref:Phosphatase domain-containing protein n=2 Tax=Deinococcus sonorensis TaxID=309891 RepID=A0AAU7UA59_9DEIO